MATHADAARTTDVAITREGFEPKAIEVRAGSRVTWTNRDEEDHTISSAEIESGAIGAGGRFTFRFEHPGRYRYFCMIHPRVVGDVFVE